MTRYDFAKTSSFHLYMKMIIMPDCMATMKSDLGMIQIHPLLQVWFQKYFSHLWLPGKKPDHIPGSIYIKIHLLFSY